MQHDKAALVASWKRRSCQDLKAANVLISEDGLRETTLFHLQQAIEKALKAYLVWCEVNFPHTHDLELQVVRQACDFIVTRPGWVKTLAFRRRLQHVMVGGWASIIGNRVTVFSV